MFLCLFGKRKSSAWALAARRVSSAFFASQNFLHTSRPFLRRDLPSPSSSAVSLGVERTSPADSESQDGRCRREGEARRHLLQRFSARRLWSPASFVCASFPLQSPTGRGDSRLRRALSDGGWKTSRQSQKTGARCLRPRQAKHSEVSLLQPSGGARGGARSATSPTCVSRRGRRRLRGGGREEARGRRGARGARRGRGAKGAAVSGRERSGSRESQEAFSSSAGEEGGSKESSADEEDAELSESQSSSDDESASLPSVKRRRRHSPSLKLRHSLRGDPPPQLKVGSFFPSSTRRGRGTDSPGDDVSTDLLKEAQGFRRLAEGRLFWEEFVATELVDSETKQRGRRTVVRVGDFADFLVARKKGGGRDGLYRFGNISLSLCVCGGLLSVSPDGAAVLPRWSLQETPVLSVRWRCVCLLQEKWSPFSKWERTLCVQTPEASLCSSSRFRQSLEF